MNDGGVSLIYTSNMRPAVSKRSSIILTGCSFFGFLIFITLGSLFFFGYPGLTDHMSRSNVMMCVVSCFLGACISSLNTVFFGWQYCINVKKKHQLFSKSVETDIL